MDERILLPSDGSPGVDRTIEESIDLASRFASTIPARYRLGPRMSPIDADMDPGDGEAVLDRAEQIPTEDVHERAAVAGVTALARMRIGIPSEVIPSFATAAGIDLVGVGIHGRTGIDRYLLGSVTEAVIRWAPMPVLTVRSPSDRG